MILYIYLRSKLGKFESFHKDDTWIVKNDRRPCERLAWHKQARKDTPNIMHSHSFTLRISISVVTSSFCQVKRLARAVPAYIIMPYDAASVAA